MGLDTGWKSGPLANGTSSSSESDSPRSRSRCVTSRFSSLSSTSSLHWAPLIALFKAVVDSAILERAAIEFELDLAKRAGNGEVLDAKCTRLVSGGGGGGFVAGGGGGGSGDELGLLICCNPDGG